MNTTLAAIVAEWLGLAMIGLMAWILWRAHRSKDNKIDLSALLVDTVTGNVTLAKFGGLLALLSSTWIVVYLAVDKSLTDTAFAAYVATWGAVKVANDVIQAKKDG